MKKLKFPRLAYNWLSGIGIVGAVITILLMTFLYVIGIFTRVTNPYLGIFLYMVLPPILVVSLLLIPLGMFRTWRRVRKTGEVSYPSWPYVDLNQKSHRNAALVFILGTGLFVLVSAVGGYEAYHYSESVAFCGKTCHTVMKPEFTAYQNSPHARVACVACHVGPGADWFAKSKISGLYQVYAVIANVYPRPIETPIRNLRPARETCEQCHWPAKFFGGQQRVFNHYMYDHDNTRWSINLLVKTGGGNPEVGRPSGIHWHTFLTNNIEYIARDRQLQNIPWVRATNIETGKATVYRDKENPLSDEEIAAATPRRFDCMDCHNRPSHIYHSPDYDADIAMEAGRINTTLPDIKQVAVKAMAAKYENDTAATNGIAGAITEYYRDHYPEIIKTRPDDINDAIAAVQDKYAQSIFPEMKVRWEVYPDNIGHFISPGCMRCHTGSLTTEDGHILSRDCTICHTIISQGKDGATVMATSPDGLEFVHPEDIDEAWKEMNCNECHSGTQP
nr:NapC/NirT family cytochrome c [candidate division Zixibacteria bacterium]